MTPWSTKSLKRQGRVSHPVEMHILPAAGGLLPAGTAYSNDECPTASFLDPKEPARKAGTSLPPLLEEDYLNEIKANSGVRSWWFYKSSTSLPVSRRVARVTLWGGFRLDAGWYPRLECFW